MLNINLNNNIIFVLNLILKFCDCELQVCTVDFSKTKSIWQPILLVSE